MFDLSWTELLIVGVVALIAIGPKELPGALRTLGQWMGKIRRMASDFQSQFNEAMREAEMDDLRKQVQDLSDTARGYTNFDPLSDVQSEIDSLMDDSPAREPAPRRADAEKDRAEKDRTTSDGAPIGETAVPTPATVEADAPAIEHAATGADGEPKTEPKAGRDA